MIEKLRKKLRDKVEHNKDLKRAAVGCDLVAFYTSTPPLKMLQFLARGIITEFHGYHISIDTASPGYRSKSGDSFVKWRPPFKQNRTCSLLRLGFQARLASRGSHRHS